MIYNASAYEEEKDERIRSLLHFISTNEPGKDDFSNRLSLLVEKKKENEKFRSDYNAMNLHDRDIQRAAKREGFAEGARETAIMNAKNFLKEGDSPEKVARCTGLPLEEVQKLTSEIK